MNSFKLKKMMKNNMQNLVIIMLNMAQELKHLNMQLHHLNLIIDQLRLIRLTVKVA